MPSSHPFSLGLLVGRFQMLHLGHQYMIDTALAICDRVGVLVGSSQESGTAVNPFSFELRQEMLRTLYGARILIAPLPDIGVGNNAAWGDYVLKNAIRAFGAAPDLAVSGAEGRRTSWFHMSSSSDCETSEISLNGQKPSERPCCQRDDAMHADRLLSAGHGRLCDDVIGIRKPPEPAELYLPKAIDISASRLRDCLLRDDFTTWAEYTDPRLYARYKELRALVLASARRLDTESL